MWPFPPLFPSSFSLSHKKEIIGYTSLYYAAAEDRLNTVKFLVKNGANANEKNKIEGPTPLHFAVKLGKLDEVVKFLVLNGANVNTKDNDDKTPLHFAAKKDRLPVVKFLILNGAIVEQKDIDDGAETQTIKDYLQAVFDYDNKKNKKLEDKITFIYSNKNNEEIFNFLIKLAFSRSAKKFIEKKDWKNTAFYKLYENENENEKRKDFEKILGVKKQDEYINFVEEVIKKNNFCFKKQFLERKNKRSDSFERFDYAFEKPISMIFLIN